MTPNNAFALVAILILTACTGGPIQPARSVDQQLAYAYTTHTAVLDAAANALEAGSLSVDDAEGILKLADESRLLLDAARVALGAGDIATAEGRLALGTNVLEQLLVYLRARGIK